MKITEKRVKIKDLAIGFNVANYNGSDEDVTCYNFTDPVTGIPHELNCRPKYQRNFVYKDKQKEEVINTVFKGYKSGTQFPLSIIYWSKFETIDKQGQKRDYYELLDGQQRTLSLLLFREGQDTTKLFNPAGETFTGLDADIKDWFDNYELTVYVCEADDTQSRKQFEAELLQWFSVINIAGESLKTQELRNAIYSGTWVSDAKKYFSNENSVIFRAKYQVEKYFSEVKKGSMNRQLFLEYMIEGKANLEGITIENYMSKHRLEPSAIELFEYFEQVTDWIKTTFPRVYDKEAMLGQDWCRIYNEYHATMAKTPAQIEIEFNQLLWDDELENKKGIVEYILSGEAKYLNIRDFDKKTKMAMFRKQNGVCPLCEQEDEELDKQAAAEGKTRKTSLKTRYTFEEMEADHIVPWAHGGKTELGNCCMLCRKHNRTKSDTYISYLKDYVDNL